MRAERVVEAPPAFHDDACLSERVEDLAIEKLVTDAGVEALDVTILPRALWLDVGGLCAHGGDPVLDGLRGELGDVVRPDVLRHAPQDEEIGEDVDDCPASALLDDGRVLVVEYKGGFLATADDAKEKQLVGELWAARSGGKCLFAMVMGRDYNLQNCL